ncbi:MAG: DUF167 domain-containing protein [Candidatus Woesearchaeota archaeon]
MDEIKESIFKVIVKPNSKENKIIGFDLEKNAYKISIKEPADKDKANKELIRFLSKYFKKRVSIIKGLRSKEKIIKTV